MTLKRALIPLFLALGFVGAQWAATKDHSEARGIAVGIPKAFDNRTLSLMLDTLNQSLSGLRVIDQPSLAKAIGTIQGSSVTESSSALTVQGAPPSITGAQKAPAPLPWNSDMATIPALANQQYGLGASDLLSEQVDLTYQIFNIRMLLDRSLSDRVLWPVNDRQNKGNGTPRLETVIGMNVTIDPPRDAENSAAVVEITLYYDRKDKNTRPSLVAVMPQEHTYNSATLNSKATAFGGSAIAKVVTVGYTQRRRAQTYFLFRDNDTVAFERQLGRDASEITFGWVFRPVLGRKSVAPGTRQMFAVVSLPQADSLAVDLLQKQTTEAYDLKQPRYVELRADVRTYWRKFDPHTLTTANNEEIRPWSKVGHVLSLGTSLTYAPKGDTHELGYTIQVPFTSAYLDTLSCKLNRISWLSIGGNRALVSVRGENFFHDTQVAIGGKLLTGAADGLRIASDQGFDIYTDMSALLSDGSILSRYAPATALEVSPNKSGAFIQQIDPSSPMSGVYELSILPEFQSPKGSCLVESDLADNALGQPLVAWSGSLIPGPYQFFHDPDRPECLRILARLPVSVAKDLSGVVSVKFPFRGKLLEAAQRVYDPNSAFSAQLLSGNRDFLVVRSDGPFIRPNNECAFSPENWRILANRETIKLTNGCPTRASSSSVFCLLTPHDNMARLIFPDPPSASVVSKPTPPLRKGKHPLQSKPMVKSAPPPTVPVPKTVLLQMGLTVFGPDQKPIPVLDSRGNPIQGLDGCAVHQVTWVGTYPISLPSSKPDAPKPSLDKDQKQTIHRFDEVSLSFTGAALGEIGQVLVGSIKLTFNSADDGKSISVLIPRSLTKDPPHQIDLLMLDKQGNPAGIIHVAVVP